MRYIWLTFAAVVLVVVVRMSVFTVDPTEFVYVTQFGAPVAVYDGARSDDAGLHFRWPWPVQSVQRLDRRLQHFDLPATELLTHDPEGKTIDKTLTVEAYVCWRIIAKDDDATAVDRFIRRMGTPERARTILGQRLNSLLGALVSQLRMDDLISTATNGAGEPRVDAAIEDLRRRLLDGVDLPRASATTVGLLAAPLREGPLLAASAPFPARADGLRAQARDEYGVELVDVRLRRFNHPEQVREAIFSRIRSERDRKVAYYQSEGAKKAKNIATEAEEKVRDLLAKARAEEKILKGQAETEADVIRNRAHSKDPDFYVFLKKLDKMQSILGENKTLLLLSTRRPIFDLIFQPPQPEARPGVPVEKIAAPQRKDEKDRPPSGGGH